MKKLDSLPVGPGWTCDLMEVEGDRRQDGGRMMGERLELWKRDPIECVKELIGNPLLKDHVAYAPQKVFQHMDGAETDRVWDEMWTGDWWWDTQVSNCLNFCAEEVNSPINRDDYPLTLRLPP